MHLKSKYTAIFWAAVLSLFSALPVRAADDPALVKQAADKIVRALKKVEVSGLKSSDVAGLSDPSELAKAIIASFKPGRWGELAMDLRSMLNHPDPMLRETACHIIGQMAMARHTDHSGRPIGLNIAKSFLPEMQARLNNPAENDPYVHKNLIDLLVGIDPRGAIKPLQKFAEETKIPELQMAAKRAARDAEDMTKPDTPKGKLARCRRWLEAFGRFTKKVGVWVTIPTITLGVTQYGKFNTDSTPNTYTTDTNPDPRIPVLPTPATAVPGERVENPFGLVRYLKALGPDFLKDLAKQGKGGHWLDVGAGGVFAPEEFLSDKMNPLFDAPEYKDRPEVQALKQLYQKKREDRASVTAISYNPEESRKEDFKGSPNAPTDVPKFNGKLDVVRGQDIERVYAWVLTRDNGRPSLITDATGVYARSEEPDTVVRNYANMVRPDGAVYLGAPPDSSKIRIVLDNGPKKGQTVSMDEWLKSLKAGVEVTPPATAGGAYRLRRTQGDIKIPHLELDEQLMGDKKEPRIYREVDDGS